MYVCIVGSMQRPLKINEGLYENFIPPCSSGFPHPGLFVGVSSMSFLIPPTSYPARCGLLITTLLVCILSSLLTNLITIELYKVLYTSPGGPYNPTNTISNTNTINNSTITVLDPSEMAFSLSQKSQY